MKLLIFAAAFACAAMSKAAAPLMPTARTFTHVAFVIDTSGSMRDPTTNQLWTAAQAMARELIASHPEVQFLALFDASGRPMIPGEGWLPRNADTVRKITATIATYNEDSPSNPMPGVLRALRSLPPPSDATAQPHICVIGDEINSSDQPAAMLNTLEVHNPADRSGHRRVSISAVQLPTTIRYSGGGMGNTGVRFQELMTEVAIRHGGTYTLLRDLNAP
jgi:hypothetical protein